MNTINKAVVDPSLYDVLQAFKFDIFKSLHCVKMGTIQSFNLTKRTAQIKILFKRVLADGSSESYPLLVDCPVFVLQGGGSYIQMPIAAGDPCLVLFADRNIDNWFATGAEGIPFNARCHDIADGIALVGVNPLTSSMPASTTGVLQIKHQGATISIDATGNVTIDIPTGKKLTVSGGSEADILGTAALALLSELSSLISAFNSHTHTGVTTGGGTSGAPSSPASSATGTTKLKGS